MNISYPNLLSPLKVGRYIFKNRIVMAPFFPQNGESGGIPTECGIAYYEKRSRGGIAQLTVGETPVDFDYANRKTDGFIDLCSVHLTVRHQSMLRELTLAIQQHGAIAAIELSHAGQENSPATIAGGKNPIGPSAYVRTDGISVHEIDERTMHTICNNFARTAERAKGVGFDSIVIHAGHGWLLAQFLSPLSNHRLDEYGGSFENRARFPLRIIRAVREQIGKEMLIELRISADELTEGGMDINDAIAFVKLAEPYIDIVHVSVGVYKDPVRSRTFPTIYDEHGCNAYLAEQIKRAVDIPVMVVGAITDPELAESLIANGKCDLVAMVKQLIAEPEYARKLAVGRRDKITPCLRCYNCMTGFPGVAPNILCSVNPMAVREFREPYNRPFSVKKKILIAGGGVGGMKAAITAAEQGHNVIMAESSDKLGGKLLFADFDPHKEDIHRFRTHLEQCAASLPIDLRLNTAVTPELVREISPDMLICAIGAEPIVPLIPGLDMHSAIFATDAYSTDLVKIGSNVVIIGGGLVGCELGIFLHERGKKVTIMEMADEIAPDCFGMHRPALLDKLRPLTLLTGSLCTAVRGCYVEYKDNNGNSPCIEADTVIVAVGMAAKAAEATLLTDAAVMGISIGDCVKSGKIIDAIHGAYFAAVDI